jgi:hypothetical protein
MLEFYHGERSVESATIPSARSALRPGLSAFVLAATVGGFGMVLLVMIAVSAGTLACILSLPTHSLRAPNEVGASNERGAARMNTCGAVRMPES